MDMPILRMNSQRNIEWKKAETKATNKEKKK